MQVLSKQSIESQRQKIINAHGPWTAHDIALAPGISTLDKGLWQQWRVDFFHNLILKNASDGKYSRKLKILDLACLEGLFAIEFARMGHITTGLEIRESHLAKANFARDILELGNCSFVQGDVRDIPGNLGSFDVIICAGILYHLDFPDVVDFLSSLCRRSTSLVVIDSHFAYGEISESVLPISAMKEYDHQGKTYRGREIVEHAPHVSSDEKAKVHVWASIDNTRSVWLSEPDVVSIMKDNGLTLAEKAFPSEEYKKNNRDRPTLVFKKSVPNG